MNPLVVASLTLVTGMFIASALGYGGGDGDLWWQRQLGEAVLRTHALPGTLGPATFTAPDARWIPHEWIFATLWALANRVDARLWFAVGCAAIAVATVTVEAYRSRGAGPRERAVMLVIVGLGLLPSFGLRAQILGWPLLALVMLALESGPRRSWFAFPLAIVWYNLHASALIVPCIVLVHGIGRAIESRRLADVGSPLALAAACALASVATPFGTELPRFIVAWSSNSATALIYEWLPAAPDKILILAGVIVIAALLVAGEWRGARLTWSQRLLAAGLFAATMLHIRNLGPFCIVAGPWAAAALTALVARAPAAKRLTWRSDGGLAAIALGAAIGFVGWRLGAPVGAGTAAPAIAQLISLHAPLRVACEDFSWCSRFAAEPDVRVFLDGRTDAYPATVFADYRTMLRGDAVPVARRWRIDAAVVHVDGRFARSLAAAGWTRLRSREPQVYLRPRRAALLEAPEAVSLRRVGTREIR